MTGPSTSTSSPTDRTVVQTVAATVRENLPAMLVAVLVFVTSVPTTIFAMQTMLWERLRNDLFAVRAGRDVVAVTPFDVIFLQVKVALLVGFLLALEVFLLRLWWARSALPRWSRPLVALVGVTLLPVGVVFGYEFFFRAVFDLVFGDGLVSAPQFVRLACFVSLATGVAAQLAFAGGVRALARTVARTGS